MENKKKAKNDKKLKQTNKEIAKMKEVITNEAAINSNIIKENRNEFKN